MVIKRKAKKNLCACNFYCFCAAPCATVGGEVIWKGNSIGRHGCFDIWEWKELAGLLDQAWLSQNSEMFMGLTLGHSICFTMDLLSDSRCRREHIVIIYLFPVFLRTKSFPSELTKSILKDHFLYYANIYTRASRACLMRACFIPVKKSHSRGIFP